MKKYFIYIICVLAIGFAVLPMGLSPEWNGENMWHRNQYEVLAESMLKGHVYLEYDAVFTAKLSQMDNPYDTKVRDLEGIPYKWDHAYYKGRYYMYFGVVPVILTFLPYRIITGHSLNTYHATQLYVAIFIIGIFYLFYYLKLKTKSKISKVEYALAATGVSFMSVWYATGYPALYTTAITSAMMFSILSIIFYVKTCFEKKNKLRNILIGAFLGALIFGCRPTLGFTNLLFFPALLSILKNEKKENKIFIIFITLIPFIIIGFLLMMYNYMRFDNVLEFGQKYQLTSCDQTNIVKDNLNLSHFKKQLENFFFYYEDVEINFPYIRFLGLFYNYPVLVFPIIMVLSKKFWEKLKKNKLLSIYLLIMLSIVISVIAIVIMSPYVLVRYHMDVIYLFGILLYISYLLMVENDKYNIRRILFAIVFIDMIIKSYLLYMVPDMYNFPSYLYKYKHKKN